MSIRPRPYTPVRPYGARRPTFIPRPPMSGGVGAGLGSGAGAGSLLGIIGGLSVPILCLGCLASMALLGLFATMIGAATYMNRIQQEVRKLATGAGATMDVNLLILCCALLCSIYVLSKHRRGVAVSS